MSLGQSETSESTALRKLIYIKLHLLFGWTSRFYPKFLWHIIVPPFPIARSMSECPFPLAHTSLALSAHSCAFLSLSIDVINGKNIVAHKCIIKCWNFDQSCASSFLTREQCKPVKSFIHSLNLSMKAFRGYYLALLSAQHAQFLYVLIYFVWIFEH